MVTEGGSEVQSATKSGYLVKQGVNPLAEKKFRVAKSGAASLGHAAVSSTYATNFIEFSTNFFTSGGKYRNWKKRYFVLTGTTVRYYVNEGDAAARGEIDLATGRGVRQRHHCSLEWPKEAKEGISFGLSTEGRTFYLYGTDKEDIE